MLAGYKDAFALTAIASAVACAHPMLAGSPLAVLSVMLPMAGGAYLSLRKTQKWLNRVDTSKREDFILKSDKWDGEFRGVKGIRIGYTKDENLPLDIRNDFLMRHSAIIGQSGVGKTVLGEYILYQQAIRGGGWIFIDAKIDKDTRNKLYYIMKMLGREDDFYVLNVDDPDNSNTYNPILNGDPDEVSSRLLNLLPSSDSNPGADYYRQAANYALTVITGALKAAKLRYHFSDLAIMLQSGAAMSQLERLVPAGPEKRVLQIFLDQFKKKSKEGVQINTDRLKEVLGGMSGRIALFAQGKFGKVFNTYTPEIDLTDIIRGQKFLYVMLPTMGKDVAALNLGKMILSDLRTAVYNLQNLSSSERPNPPFLVFADEMGAYVMQGIARLFEQARSAGVAMIPAFQAFSQLNLVSPDFADIIIQNTWNKFFFKFSSKESPELAAEIIGKHKVHTWSLSTGESQSSSAQTLRATPESSAGSGGNIGESWREVEEHRVTPDQLKSLGIGECIAMSGPRIYHIKVPKLEFPKTIPDFEVCRHHSNIPKGEKGLYFEEKYKEFLTDVGDDSNIDNQMLADQKEAVS